MLGDSKKRATDKDQQIREIDELLNQSLYRTHPTTPYRWEQNEGKAYGLKLYFNDSPFPNLFVKRVKLLSFPDVTCLKIAARVGIKTPEVELKENNNAVYQFSHNLTRNTSKGKYEYKDLDYYCSDKNYSLNNEKGLIVFNGESTETLPTFSQSFEIDKILIAILLFGLDDIHYLNVGVIRSKKKWQRKIQTGSCRF